MNIFQLKKVSFSYPNANPILESINLDIQSGESIAILGANGCGKSTLLKLLVGLLSPTNGNIYAFEDELSLAKLQDTVFTAQYYQKIGFLFQDSDVQLFCSSVYDELSFGLLQLNLSIEDINSRINDICELLSIGNLLDKAPFHLSGGEKKKVALAAILLLNPQVLILDEPTDSLDPKTQYWLINLLSQLNTIGKTLVVTSHNLDLIGKLTTRGILLNEQHQIIADLPIHELLQNKNLLREANLIY